MRKALRLFIGLGFAGGLGACGHTVALTPLDGGEPVLTTQAFAIEPLRIKLDGKTYHGRWRTVASVQDLPVLQPDPVAPPEPIQVGRYYGQRGAGGYGVADFVAKDGSSIVCRFRYERGQSHGSGLCRSNTGRSFSLMIDLGAEG
jgi:hypothetical protein